MAARMAANLVADELEDANSNSNSDSSSGEDESESASWRSHSASWEAFPHRADLDAPLAASNLRAGAPNPTQDLHHPFRAQALGTYDVAGGGHLPLQKARVHGAGDGTGAEEEVQSASPRRRRRRLVAGAVSEASFCHPSLLREPGNPGDPWIRRDPWVPESTLPWSTGGPPQVGYYHIGGYHPQGGWDGAGGFRQGRGEGSQFVGSVPREALHPNLRPDLWGLSKVEGGGGEGGSRGKEVVGWGGRRGGRHRAWDFSRLLQSCGGARGDGLLLQRLMELAEALEASDLSLFRDRFRWLSQYANPQGDAIVRVLHYFLHGLLLRCTGMGYASFNAPSTRPAEVRRLNAKEHTASRPVDFHTRRQMQSRPERMRSGWGCQTFHGTPKAVA